MTASRRSLQGGFSLLELLVAFVIMAMSLGMLYRASGGTVRSLADTEQVLRATLLAQSLLNSRDAVPETGWQERGESAGFGWQVQSAPFHSGLSGPDVVTLHQVRVRLTWMDGRGARQVEYSTLLPQASAAAGGPAR
jgi:general secretion pathway protein I